MKQNKTTRPRGSATRWLLLTMLALTMGMGWSQEAWADSQSQIDSLKTVVAKMQGDEAKKASDELFREWYKVPMEYVRTEQLGQAQQETKLLFTYAQEVRNELGIALSEYCFGRLYRSLGNHALAIEWFEKAADRIDVEKEFDLYSKVMTGLCNSLSDSKRIAEDVERIRQWRDNVEKVYKNGKGNMPADQHFNYQYMLNLYEIDALEQIHDFEPAERLLRETATLGGMDMSNDPMLMTLWADYHWQKALVEKDKTLRRQHWQQAYDLFNKALAAAAISGDAALIYVRLRAECLFNLGRYQESAELYHRYTQRKDTLNQQETARLVAQMQSVFEVNELKAEQEREQMAHERSQYRWAIGVTALLALGFVIFFLLRSRAAKRMARLEAEKELIRVEKERIDGELQIARNIQLGMVPQVFPSGNPQIDLFASMTPAKEVGGDLYDYAIVGQKLYFCLGDVSGKGVPASLFMTTAVNLFRVAVQQQLLPAQMATQMNQTLCENNETGMFVTMFIGLIDLPTGHLDFCNCGHNPPILSEELRVKSEELSFIEMIPNAPLGLWPGMEYEGEEIEDISGRPFFVYTDGLNEAENPRQEQFGDDHILQLLSEHPFESARKTVEMMKAEVIKHAAGAEQSDDLTMLCLKVN